jgi:hypothetical protein
MPFDLKPDLEARCLKALSISDRFIGLIFVAIAMGISVWGFRTLGPALDSAASFNIWVQADAPRVISNLTDVASNHYRTSIHPASSIILTPIVQSVIAPLSVYGQTLARRTPIGSTLLICGVTPPAANWQP